MERGRTANVNVRHCEAEGDSDAAGECGKARWCETLTGLTTEGGNCAVCLRNVRQLMHMRVDVVMVVHLL